MDSPGDGGGGRERREEGGKFGNQVMTGMFDTSAVLIQLSIHLGVQKGRLWLA